MLNSETVEKLFVACLRNEGEAPLVEGVVNHAYLNTEGKEKEILELLMELPEGFRVESGGGWSFLQACNDRHGNQWTGLQVMMEKLFLLGIAANKAKWLLPREIWNALPGGMPYVVIGDFQ